MPPQATAETRDPRSNRRSDPAGPPSRVAVVLAAGQGTRLASDLPKVLHQVCGRPMLEWVLDAARAAGCGRLLVVVGHGAGEVRSAVGGDDVTWVEQREQLGTGHAVAQAKGEVADDATVLVLSGDVPLVTPATLERLADAAAGGWGAMAVAELDDPGSLGRVVPRQGAGGRALDRIVEAADATADELAVKLVNAGIYALPAGDLFARIDRLEPDNAKGEYYLTDALSQAAAEGEELALVTLDEPAEALGVNTRADLARAHRAMIDRHLEALMASGVTVLEPPRTVVEPTVEVGRDTVLHPGVSLLGRSRIGARSTVHQGVWLRDAEVGDEVEIHPYSVVDGARLAAHTAVGPFARLRPASVLLEGARVGNFVEVKKSTLGRGTKANHLSYLGDATLGDDVNVGAGTITCNYDGIDKHPTDIGDGAFIGSNTSLVAPVVVGAGAITGAGSVITQDVPEGALAVGRARQRNVEGWARKRDARRRERS